MEDVRETQVGKEVNFINGEAQKLRDTVRCLRDMLSSVLVPEEVEPPLAKENPKVGGYSGYSVPLALEIQTAREVVTETDEILKSILGRLEL